MILHLTAAVEHVPPVPAAPASTASTFPPSGAILLLLPLPLLFTVLMLLLLQMKIFTAALPPPAIAATVLSAPLGLRLCSLPVQVILSSGSDDAAAPTATAWPAPLSPLEIDGDPQRHISLFSLSNSRRYGRVILPPTLNKSRSDVDERARRRSVRAVGG